MRRDSVGHTFKVATLLCLVCSLLVSAAAVGLRSAQERNKALEKKRNILIAAGLWEPGKNVDDIFASRVTAKLLDLETGDYSEAYPPEEYDAREASRDPKLSIKILAETDIAGLKRREKLTQVFLISKDDGSLDQIVLPIRGYGLWSTLWGFLSVDADTTTIRGLTYYEHAETPGLGGEVDNPLWKAKWRDPQNPKKIYDENWKVRIEVIKGRVLPSDPLRQYKVDGLMGATITSRGVKNMLQYWLGQQGFAPYLAKIRAEGGGNG